jgi:NAD(P)H dehydrogenase (quinone)
VSGTTHADLAEAAAIILTDEGRFDGATPPLTAPDALDLKDIADILTELSGRTIHRIVADDDDEWAAGLTGHGVPAEQANVFLGMFRVSRRGEFAATGSTLENLLGRPATPVRSILKGAATPR